MARSCEKLYRAYSSAVAEPRDEAHLSFEDLASGISESKQSTFTDLTRSTREQARSITSASRETWVLLCTTNSLVLSRSGM